MKIDDKFCINCGEPYEIEAPYDSCKCVFGEWKDATMSENGNIIMPPGNWEVRWGDGQCLIRELKK